jgi:hypothetical protein
MKNSLSLFAALSAFAGDGKLPDMRQVRQKQQELNRDSAFQAYARRHAAKRKAAQHRRSCLTAYQAKIALVKAGRGSNSLRGIPAELK